MSIITTGKLNARLALLESDIVETISAAGTGIVGTNADLSAIDSPVNGQKAHVIYRSSLGDEGGGDWVFVAGSAATVDDGTILTGDGGRWFRNFDGIHYNAAWFGALADGVTDNYAVMDTLLADLPVGAVLKTPRGTMMMSEKVTCTRGDITCDFTGTKFKATDAGLDDADFSYFIHFTGTNLVTRIANIVIIGGMFDVLDWRDGTDRIGSGTCPSQSGMTSTQIKLASTASAVNNFYAEQYIFILEGTGRGQEAFISAYDGTTKICTLSSAWTIQPDSTSVYGILLNGADADDKATRGFGRLGFSYCENVKIRETMITGGHGGFDFRGCSYLEASSIFVETVHENAWNYLDDCDNCQLANFRFIDVGEGIDHGDSRDITGNNGIISLMAESDDEGLDFNGVKDGAYSNILIYGGNNSINIHAGLNPTYQNLDSLATYNVTLSNIQCFDFKNAGFIIQIGRSADTGTLPSQSGLDTDEVKLPTNSTTDEYTTDSIAGLTITITGGTGSGQSKVILSYNATTKIAVVASVWTTPPDNTSTYSLVASGPQANDLVKNISLDNCYFESTQSAAYGVWIGEPLTSFPVRCANIYLNNCHIRTSHIGCRVSFAKNVHITGGSCYSTADRAHYWGYNATYFCEDCSLRSHEMRAVTDNTTHGAFQCDYGINISVDSCTILSNSGGRGIFMSNVRNAKATNNIVRLIGQEGIYFDYSASAFTDTTWSGVTSRNILNTDNNIGAVITDNEVVDWAATVPAIRVNYNVATAASFRGVNISRNTMILDTVANSSHIGIRIGHHATVTGLGAIANFNIFDRNLSTKFHVLNWTTLYNESQMLGNIGNTASRNEGLGTPAYIKFHQDDVAANQSAVEIICDEVAGLFTASSTRWVAPAAGTIIGIQVKSNAARSAGTLTVEAYKTTTATGLTAVLDGTNTTQKITRQRVNSNDLTSADVFAEGDELNIRITTDGSWAPTTADIQVTLIVSM